MKQIRSHFLIIGSGLAGLSFALKVADKGRVIILTKSSPTDTNTALAQGGIASVTAAEDSFEKHIEDTLVAGAGLCHADVVRNIVEQAPDRIRDLKDWGVDFANDLTREGGHSERRILHFQDQTGAQIHAGVMVQVVRHPNITLVPSTMAIDILINKQIDPMDMTPTRCQGVYALNTLTGEVTAYLAGTTVLATGGAGKVYLYTSNWSGATGDGIAMAYRAGARIANLEFMQFHPTCLYHPQSRNFLISESLRGEGGKLRNSKGEDFMTKYHPMASLAPRDIVARSIDAEMIKSGSPCVTLDMTHHPESYLQNRFPAIWQKCMSLGINMATQPIPVVPAAHYLCGGILTNVYGQTDIPGLLAMGENACTGLHGANRLASNSLLECLAIAHNASLNVSKLLVTDPKELEPTTKEAPQWQAPNQTNDDELIVIAHMWDEIRQLMWNYVGIVRSNKRLARALHRLTNINSEVKEYYSNFRLTPDILELRNIAIVADLSVRCAIKRKESRGIHYNLDYSIETVGQAKVPPKDTILVRGLA